MASELIENDILEIDPNYDVETKNWLLKNYDPMYLIERFQGMEKDTSTYGTKFKKLFNALYQSILNGTFSKKVADSNGDLTENGISEDELKILNYVLRYKKGFYEKGQQIVSIKEDNSSGHFNLLDPGYYLIEVSGPGQEGGTDFASRDTLGGNNYYDNVLTRQLKWCSEDGKITLWLGSHMSWRIQIKDVNNESDEDFGGKFELNDKNVFLFKSSYAKDDVVTPDDVRLTFDENSVGHYYSSNDGKGKEISSLKQLRNNTVIYYKDEAKDYQEKVFLNISKDELDNDSTQCYKYLDYMTANFWDKFSLSNFDMLTDTNDFAKIILSANSYRLRISNDAMYDYLKICANLHEVDSNVLCDSIKGVYRDILTKKIKNDCAYLISNFDLKKLYRQGTVYENYFNQIALIKNTGYYYLDAGHAYVIVNLRKNDVGRFDYTVSSNKTSIHKNDVLSITANSGDKSDQTANNNDTTNLEENLLEFKIGEQSIYNDINRGTLGSCVVSWHGSTTTTFGGGGKGSGVKRNLYNNLYWQDAEKGYIKITYLGDESLETANVAGLSSTDDIESHVLFADYDEGNTAELSNDGKLPKNSSLPIEFRRKANTFKGNSMISLNNADDTTKLSGASNLNKILYRYGNIYRDYVECCALDDLTFEIADHENGRFFDYDKTDDFKITSFSDDFLTGSPEESLLKVSISYANQNLDLDVDLLSQYNSANVEDEDTFDAIKKKTAFSIECNNFYIISFLQEVYQLTVSYKNSLDLEQITDYFNTSKVIYKNQRSVKIDHSTMNLFFDKGKPYSDNKSTEKYVIENKKYKLAGGQKVVLRLFFTSPRVRVSKSLSNFPANASFSQLCNEICNDAGFKYYFDPRDEQWKTTKINLYNFYQEDTDSFEYVEFFMPLYSLNLNVFIEKNTYKVTLIPDLYEVLNQSFINSKTEYEFYEPVSVLCSMPSYSRVSNLFITSSHEIAASSENRNNDRWYVVKPKNDLDYESFISFGSAYDELDLVRSSDGTMDKQIYNILSEEIRPIYGDKFKSVFPDTSKLFELSSVRQVFVPSDVRTKLGGFYSVSAVLQQNYVKQIIDENFIYVFSMPQCDVQIRLTAAILPFSKLQLLENGQAGNIRLFKNCTLVAFMSGGATGNGGNGAESTVDSQGRTSQGGYGGDGYIGGNSGNSGSNSFIPKPSVRKWQGFIPIGFSIYASYAGGYTYGGNGFLSCGAMGSRGDSAFNTHHNVVTNMASPTDAADAMQTTFLYTGSIFLGMISFQNNALNDQQVVLICKSGVQGNNGIDGTSGAGIYYLNGEGGGNGTPTYLKCSNDNVSMTEHNAAISIIYGNDNIENRFKSDKSGIDTIFLGGGIRGQAYTHGNTVRESVRILYLGVPISFNFGGDIPFDTSTNLNEVPSTNQKFRYAYVNENAYTNFKDYKDSKEFTLSSGLRYRCGIKNSPNRGISWSDYEQSLLGYEDPNDNKLYALFNTNGFWNDVTKAYNRTAIKSYIDMKISGYSSLGYQSGLIMLYCLNETAAGDSSGRNVKRTVDYDKIDYDLETNAQSIGTYFEFNVPDSKLPEVVNLWK